MSTGFRSPNRFYRESDTGPIYLASIDLAVESKGLSKLMKIKTSNIVQAQKKNRYYSGIFGQNGKYSLY